MYWILGLAILLSTSVPLLAKEERIPVLLKFIAEADRNEIRESIEEGFKSAQIALKELQELLEKTKTAYEEHDEEFVDGLIETAKFYTQLQEGNILQAASEGLKAALGGFFG